MPHLITVLVAAIHSEATAGRPSPKRIELGPAEFQEFQAAYRMALAAVLHDVGDIHPTSLLDVPIVQMSEPGAALVRTNGRRGTLVLKFDCIGEQLCHKTS